MNKKIDEKSFQILKKTIKNISCVRYGKRQEKGFHMELPALVGLKLTNHCNLRCRHCYEWSEHGYCQTMDKVQQEQELDINILRKVLTETRANQAGLYLWGGEPLCYSHFDELAKIIEGEERVCAVCTNSILVEEQLNSLIKIGKNLEIVIAMEGFEADNDFIRGNGVFAKIKHAIELLLEERKKKNFLGKITIHTVINSVNYDKLFEYTRYIQDLGVDSLILCFPWYISELSETLMEEYIEKKLSRLICNKGHRSWNSFKFGLSVEYADEISGQLEKIEKHKWNFNVRYVPKIKENEMRDFILGKPIMAQQRRECNSISMRMDIMPDGSVTTCKHFKEFTVGNLIDKTVSEIWNSTMFNQMRMIMDEELMPICAQCNNLYLHGE